MISYHAAGTAHLDWLFSEYSNPNSDKIAVVQGTETISPFFNLFAHGHPLPCSHLYCQLKVFETDLFGSQQAWEGSFSSEDSLISILFVSFNVRQ